MSAVRSRRVWACMGVLFVLVGVGSAVPARIYLPLQMEYNLESAVGVGGEGGEGGAIPQRHGRDMAAHPPPRLYRLLPEKRYLGIELPDFIADSKNLGKLKEKMMSSGK